MKFNDKMSEWKAFYIFITQSMFKGSKNIIFGTKKVKKKHI